MLHSCGGLPLAVLLFTFAFQNQKLAKTGLADCTITQRFHQAWLHHVPAVPHSFKTHRKLFRTGVFCLNDCWLAEIFWFGRICAAVPSGIQGKLIEQFHTAYTYIHTVRVSSSQEYTFRHNRHKDPPVYKCSPSVVFCWSHLSRPKTVLV